MSQISSGAATAMCSRGQHRPLHLHLLLLFPILFLQWRRLRASASTAHTSAVSSLETTTTCTQSRSRRLTLKSNWCETLSHTVLTHTHTHTQTTPLLLKFDVSIWRNIDVVFVFNYNISSFLSMKCQNIVKQSSVTVSPSSGWRIQTAFFFFY